MIIVLAIRGLREPEHSRQSRASHGGDWPPPLRSRWPPVPNYQEDKSVHRETLENLGRSPSTENNPDQLFGVGALAHRGLPPFIGGLCVDHSPHRITMTQTKRCPIFKFGSWCRRVWQKTMPRLFRVIDADVGHYPPRNARWHAVSRRSCVTWRSTNGVSQEFASHH